MIYPVWILFSLIGCAIRNAESVIPASSSDRSYLPSGSASGPSSILDCSDNEVLKCATAAEDLLKDSNLVFPDSEASLDKVCSMWSNFTNCIVSYTARCLSRQQINTFERSFREPQSSMNALCSDQEYRKEYLKSASCIKEVSTSEYYCGNQYRFLIDHVTGSTATIKQICCARAKFKSCIIMKTEERCEKSGSRGSDGAYQNSTAFAVRTLDKSLAFVSQQCTLISFGDDECPGIDPKLFRPNHKGPILGLERDHVASAASSPSGNHRPQQPPNPLDYSKLKQPPSLPQQSQQQQQFPIQGQGNPGGGSAGGGSSVGWNPNNGGGSSGSSNRVTEIVDKDGSGVGGSGSGGSGAYKKGSSTATNRRTTTQVNLERDSGHSIKAFPQLILIALFAMPSIVLFCHF